MNINLETILGLEFIGDEITTFVEILKKIHEGNTPIESIGFKSSSKPTIDFTEDELKLVSSIYLSFNQEEPQQEPHDISNGADV